MLAAFQELPVRAQCLLWHRVVEQDPPERVAGLSGLSPQVVAYSVEPALWRLGQSLLANRLAASGSQDCRGFRRLIEESVRPGTPRYSVDLHTHMGRCAHCATAYEELSRLRDSPRTALAEGLLPWGGAAYVRDTGEQIRAGAHRLPNWWPSRRLALGATAVGAAVAPLLVYLLMSGGSEQVQAASSVRTPPPPSPTAVVEVPKTPSPSPSGSKSPSRTPTPSKTTPAKAAQSVLPISKPKPKPEPKPKPTAQPPAAHPPNGTYAQMVNVASGLCLDIRGGAMDLGTDVITAPCTSSATQRWRVDTARGVLQSFADPGFCLDSRGSTSEGVGIWECSAVYSRNGLNLRFTVDSRGVVRPEIAPGHAVTPWGDALFLLPDRGGDGRRWKAGAK
jgi:hypothetical protein